jgi:hypothetical protein
VSGLSSDDRLRHGGAESGGIAPRAPCTLHVQAVFRDLDERQLQTLAAEMIARAHELANRPELQCDVDVSVQRAPAAARGDEC